MVERKALIFNIQKYNMYDGPGVRTLIFFKGCPLRCLWCSNPESQLRQFQVLYKKDACVHCGTCASVCPAGVYNNDMVAASANYPINLKAECIGCRECEKQCPASALAIVGEYRTISELVDIVLKDKPFYDTSGGGLTVGGGEPMMQPEALVNLLLASKNNGVNTAIETCGYARPEVVAKVAEVCDLFLFDIKHINPEQHYALTGVRNETILANLQWLLENRYNVQIRMPLLKGLNNSEEDLRALVEFLRPYRDYKNLRGVDILPYHKLGVHKYTQLGREYPIQGDPTLNAGDLESVERCFAQHSIPVSIIEH